MLVLESKQSGVTFQSGNSPSDYRMSNALFKLFWDFCNIWNSQISNETCCQVTDTDHFDVIPQANWIQNMSLETFAWTLYVIQTTRMTSTHYNDMGSLSASSGQRTPNCVTSNSNLIFSICNFVHKQRQLWFFFSQFQFQRQTQSRFKIFVAPPPWTAELELCH